MACVWFLDIIILFINNRFDYNRKVNFSVCIKGALYNKFANVVTVFEFLRTWIQSQLSAVSMNLEYS